MKKIYLLSEGFYSDYHVVGVFSTKEKAEEAVKSFKNARNPSSNFNDIEEYTLDYLSEHISDGRRQCFIRIDKDGNTSDFYFSDKTYDVEIERKGFDVQGRLYLYCFARDEEHAIKIAGEKRAQMIANNEWPRYSFNSK